jgi:hypothetical protein
MLCWIEGGAGFFLFSVLPGAAVELPGRSRPAPGVVDIRWALRRALSPTFPAGELAFFIPWRVVAENPARRSLASAARCCSTCSGRW